MRCAVAASANEYMLRGSTSMLTITGLAASCCASTSSYEALAPAAPLPPGAESSAAPAAHSRRSSSCLSRPITESRLPSMRMTCGCTSSCSWSGLEGRRRMGGGMLDTLNADALRPGEKFKLGFPAGASQGSSMLQLH